MRRQNKLDHGAPATMLGFWALVSIANRPRREGWIGAELFERTKAARLGAFPTFATLEKAGLIPATRVEWGSPEWELRGRLGLPLAPPTHRPGEWAWYSMAGHNARIVSVCYDRSAFFGGWRFNFYGYGGRDAYGPLLDHPFVEYESLNGYSGSKVYGPALDAKLAGVSSNA